MKRLIAAACPALIIGALLLLPTAHLGDKAEAILMLALFAAFAITLPIVLEIVEPATSAKARGQ